MRQCVLIEVDGSGWLGIHVVSDNQERNRDIVEVLYELEWILMPTLWQIKQIVGIYIFACRSGGHIISFVWTTSRERRQTDSEIYI